MLELGTVLCPIDFSALSRQEMALGVEVCRAFGARLVLHHNRNSDAPSGDDVEGRLSDLRNQVPRDVSCAMRLTDGPLAASLHALVVELAADLLVMGSHGWKVADHDSLTESIIEGIPCPVLTLHEGVRSERFVLHPGKIDVLVPTDLTETGAHAMAYAFEMARRIPMRLHVVHVAARGADAMIIETVRDQLYGLIPPDLIAVTPLEAIDLGDVQTKAETTSAAVSSVECYVRRGDPIEEILVFGEHLDPTFVVMGEHAHGFFRRHFTRDSAVEVLHQAPWPVWFVPAR